MPVSVLSKLIVHSSDSFRFIVVKLWLMWSKWLIGGTQGRVD